MLPPQRSELAHPDAARPRWVQDSKSADSKLDSRLLTDMTSSSRGLYEVLITEALDSKLGRLGTGLAANRDGLRATEAADRIALHLARVVERAIGAIDEGDRTAIGIDLARRLIEMIVSVISAGDLGAERPVVLGEVLQSIVGYLPDGRRETIATPLIPLLDTTLLTNAPGEPRVGHQVLTEIYSADRVDVVMAFIRRSGISPLIAALRAHCAAGRLLRVLTTTYTGSTEARALDELSEAGADIRVSYDTASTRLHAKAWLLHRQSGFSTAYIGSSNLTHSAQISGLEWNVRVSGARNPDVIDKVAAVFESYWQNPDFRPYDPEEFPTRSAGSADSRTTVQLSPTDLRAEPFQERLLEQIALSRQQGHHRNLLVSATGTGKTVIAALDYVGLREDLARVRLLFVAHREEILTQSRATFQQALRDPSFGELWVGGRRPAQFEYVFASIQSLNASGISHLDPAHFDIVIIDEFHHAAAQSYQALLEHVRPVELLGLTATPERTDGLPILNWFDGRIAAELRLWDAIDQQRLVAFAYYGIHDGIDLRGVPWRRGQGYDIEGLTNVLTGNNAAARFVVKELANRVDDLARMRALGFCVSVEHARFMARVFREAGIASTAIWSDTPEAERRAALADLAARRVSVVFSVDLFNEGIDVPAVDTLLMLRPTDSPTLFLQQLGRGLRRHVGKTLCTVLDFVGHHRKEFRFDRRFRALLGGTRKELATQVEAGFPFLPAGCHMELDRVAADIVLESIKNAVPSRWTEKVETLRFLTANGALCTLGRFLDETGLELEDVYTGNKSWSDLSAEAGVAAQQDGPHEHILRRACGRLLHVDDLVRIRTYERLVETPRVPDPAQMPEREQRLLRMLVGSLVAGAATRDTSLHEGASLLWKHPQVLAELLELLGVLAARIEHVSTPLSTHADVPLQIHARYTRVEILAAFGVGKGARVAPWQTGVYWAPDAGADLFAFTLDKTTGQFSPTTRYRDYAISPDLVHWESQSVTRADSETGRRYQHHLETGSSVMLFARRRSDERAFYFLGPAVYVKHESELPMAITWRLQHSLPGDLFAAFAAAVA
jgi:superfamily II DNA or RNA helicase/HKD family nuclease